VHSPSVGAGRDGDSRSRVLGSPRGTLSSRSHRGPLTFPSKVSPRSRGSGLPTLTPASPSAHTSHPHPTSPVCRDSATWRGKGRGALCAKGKQGATERKTQGNSGRESHGRRQPTGLCSRNPSPLHLSTVTAETLGAPFSREGSPPPNPLAAPPPRAPRGARAEGELEAGWGGREPGIATVTAETRGPFSVFSDFSPLQGAKGAHTTRIPGIRGKGKANAERSPRLRKRSFHGCSLPSPPRRRRSPSPSAPEGCPGVSSGERGKRGEQQHPSQLRSVPVGRQSGREGRPRGPPIPLSVVTALRLPLPPHPQRGGGSASLLSPGSPHRKPHGRPPPPHALGPPASSISAPLSVGQGQEEAGDSLEKGHTADREPTGTL